MAIYIPSSKAYTPFEQPNSVKAWSGTETHDELNENENEKEMLDPTIDMENTEEPIMGGPNDEIRESADRAREGLHTSWGER